LNADLVNVDSFPGHVNEFIKQVIKILQSSMLDDKFAVFVFGSLSHKRDHASIKNGTSDVDLLIIIKDDSSTQLHYLWRKLNTLQRKFFDAEQKKTSVVSHILQAIERQTGMHESIFLAREKDFKDVRFSNIFKTNKFLSKILAPSNIVIGSALCHITFVHGNKDIENTVKAMQASIGTEEHILPDLIKSLLMNTLLSLGGIFLLPFTKRATRYAIEATKWSMYAATYLMIGERPSKPSQKRFFERLGIASAFLNRWLRLSIVYEPDTRFTIIALINILKIHAMGFKIKKVR